MIEFNPICPKDKPIYEPYLFGGKERGCEYAFANLCVWGQQNATILHGHMVLLSYFKDKTVYPYPIGEGDKKAVLDAIIEDSKERKVPLHITGMCAEARKNLEKYYPGQFVFYGSQDNDDYVYAIDDLADLKGRKYHRKKNHYNRFRKNNPNYKAEPLGEDNLPLAKKMIADWYETKRQLSPEVDFSMEETALKKALDLYEELGMEGLLLINEGEALAVTLGSRVSEQIWDVHFEKARDDVDGAYTAINCEFAQYIRSRYPEIAFLNREEDMGIEGLRKAKESYYPHHMVQKCRAVLK